MAFPVSLNSDLTVVFDLDGTLVDSAPDLCQALNFVMLNAGLPAFQVDRMRPFVGRGAKGLIAQALDMLGESIAEDQLALWAEELVAFYREHIADLSQPFPGVQAALTRLAGRGVKLGVCTNKREELSFLVLEKLDLLRYFPVVLGADSLPVHKPHPDHLLKTIEDLGGRADQAVFVGDSNTDIKTAKAANVPVIAVTFGYSDVPIETLGADQLIDHFDAFECALDKLIYTE